MNDDEKACAIQAPEPDLSEREKVAVRTKALELAVQQWCTPGVNAFSATNQAKHFEKYILEGEASK